MGEKAGLTEEESAALEQIRARRVLRMDTTADWERLTTDVVEGFRIRLSRGELGLEKVDGWRAAQSRDVMDMEISARGKNRGALLWACLVSLLSVVAVMSCFQGFGLQLNHIWGGTGSALMWK